MVLHAYARVRTRGVSFISVMIAAALTTMVFGGLLTSFQTMLQVVAKSKLEAGARALANERLEYVRSLAYDSVGTVSGIPEGIIPQTASTTLNGVTYHERVVVQYVDAPDDGTGASDVNGILADYKSVKIEYSWNYKGATSSLALISNIVPKGIETTAGGGALTVNVFDAEVQPLSGAAVHVYNDTTTSTIDTTRYTNIDGVAMFAGAPAAANYQITVTDTGYSTDQTYSASTTNPNPSTPHVAVLASEVSTMNFQIDELSDLTIETVGEAITGTFTDTFASSASISTSSQTTVTGGAVVLAGGAGSYAASGTVYSIAQTPGTFDVWESVTVVASTSASTSIAVQLFTSTTSPTLVPDAVLPGNSVGFTGSSIDISTIPAGSYPTLVLGATLTSTDTNDTPLLHEWQLQHVVQEPAVGTVPFTLTGDKTIGLSGASEPVYKYSQSHSTDSAGSVTIADLEWDVYDVTLDTSAYDIARACAQVPYSLLPDDTATLTLTVVSAVANSLRVRVEDTSGDPILGASVDIQRSGLSDTDTTGVCGQVFFNTGLIIAGDYELEVSASGYTTESVSDFSVDGTTVTTVVLSTT